MMQVYRKCRKGRKFRTQKKSHGMIGKKWRTLIFAQHLLQEKSHLFNVAQKDFVNY